MVPPLNPYFLLKNDMCTGVWSGEILSEMSRVRPHAQWEDISESFGNIAYRKDGRMVINPEEPGRRITSLKLANYRMLSNRLTVQ